MASITLRGNPVHTNGELPSVGSTLPDFTLSGNDLADVSQATFAGKRLVLNIFPSVDTPVCAASVRRFNEEASSLPNTVVACVSADLPFAFKRFCAAESLANVVTLSSFRGGAFGETFGLTLLDSPLRGLLARAVVVADESGKVIHTELVPEIAQEPDYSAALAALRA